MFGTFLRHYFRFLGRSGRCLVTVCALLVSTGALADIVNIPTGPFDGQVVLTNLVFADWDEYYSYKQNMLSVLSQMENMHELCTNRLAKVHIDITSAGGSLFQALVKISLWGSSESAYATGNQLVRDAREYVQSANSDLVSASRSCDDMRSTLSNVDTELKVVRQAIESDATEYHGIFATSAGDDSSSGGCSCPDYTTILNTISGNLYNISNQLRSFQEDFDEYASELMENFESLLYDYLEVYIDDNLQYLTYPLNDIITGMDDVLSTGSGAGSSGNYRGLGQGLGYFFKTNGLSSARILTELLALHDVTGNYWLNKTATADSNISQFVYDVFNPLRQLFANDVTDASSYSQYYPAIAQTLNFLWTRNVHPTNTFANPLYVTNTSPMTLEITPDSAGSSEHPISVSVGNPEVIVNQDGVIVTNRLALNVSIEGFSGDDGDALNVKVVNFEDLRDILDDYFNSSSDVEDAEEEKEDENDESEEELDDELKANGEDPHFYLSIQTFHDALSKYRTMLNSIRLLIPDSTSPPRFYFNYSFKFPEVGSDGPSRGGDIEVVPIGPDADQAASLGRYLTVVRGFCSVIWLGLVLATALWLVKWAIHGIAFATAISMTIASGDLASVARLLPAFIKNLLSVGDA